MKVHPSQVCRWYKTGRGGYCKSCVCCLSEGPGQAGELDWEECHHFQQKAKFGTWWGIIPVIRTGDGSSTAEKDLGILGDNRLTMIQMCLCDQRQSSASWAALDTAWAAGWGKGCSSTAGSSNCNAGSRSGLPRGAAVSPAKSHESDEGTGTSENRLRDLRLFRLEKKILGKTHQCVECLVEENEEENARFCSVVPSNRTKGNGYKLNTHEIAPEHKEALLLPWSWWNTRTGCPKRFLHLWDIQKPTGCSPKQVAWARVRQENLQRCPFSLSDYVIPHLNFSEISSFWYFVKKKKWIFPHHLTNHRISSPDRI